MAEERPPGPPPMIAMLRVGVGWRPLVSGGAMMNVYSSENSESREK